MAINHLGNLKREFHHIKAIRGDGHEEYEPTMVLFKEGYMGQSFMIPLSAFWKYLDPRDNMDAGRWDRMEFDKLAMRIYNKHRFVPTRETAADAAAVVLAEQINADSGIMLCTGFSLVKCCQILDLPATGQSLAQLLMFIQDGLDDLKNMPEHVQEDTVECGEVRIQVNGKDSSVPFMLTESDMVTQ